MPSLKQSELNSIREVVACHQTVSNKLKTYSEQVTDPQIKQMFSQASTKATQSAQTLIQMMQ